MDNRQEQREPDLEQYYKEFHLWLKDFEKTDEYKKVVADYETDWIEIYKELGRIFEYTVWLEKYGDWMSKQRLLERESKKIVVYDSLTLESVEELMEFQK